MSFIKDIAKSYFQKVIFTALLSHISRPHFFYLTIIPFVFFYYIKKHPRTRKCFVFCFALTLLRIANKVSELCAVLGAQRKFSESYFCKVRSIF